MASQPREGPGAAGAELISVSPPGADCQWLDLLRMRQIASTSSLQRSQSNPILGSPFFPYFDDQDSYAAAVRRTQAPVKYPQITPINQSRSSSPTQYGLTKNFSCLLLNSRDRARSGRPPGPQDFLRGCLRVDEREDTASTVRLGSTFQWRPKPNHGQRDGWCGTGFVVLPVHPDAWKAGAEVQVQGRSPQLSETLSPNRK
ncbi:uncharacterized protein LOC104850189 [Fukomys damarensis]|uniref:uncharacterized protein LOC104850189 n=1 Tax=Fukomys damarensis TaxID=885580 RepID=UPI0008FF6526|nr:uncharacterized protein LOC104850189 [Fukomys damarensis]